MDAGTEAPGVAIVGARDDNLWTYLLVSNLERSGTTEVWPVRRPRPPGRGPRTCAGLDAFEASLDRADTTVICAYVESFGGTGGRARLEAILARANERGVRVVVAKSGSSPVGVAIARSHTAAVAGPDRLVDEVLA